MINNLTLYLHVFTIDTIDISHKPFKVFVTHNYDSNFLICNRYFLRYIKFFIVKRIHNKFYYIHVLDNVCMAVSIWTISRTVHIPFNMLTHRHISSRILEFFYFSNFHQSSLPSVH